MSYVLIFISMSVMTPAIPHQEFLSEQDCVIARVTIELATRPEFRAHGINPPVLVCVAKGQKE